MQRPRDSDGVPIAEYRASGGRLLQASFSNGTSLDTYVDLDGRLTTLKVSGNAFQLTRVREYEGSEIARELTEDSAIAYTYGSQSRLTGVIVRPWTGEEGPTGEYAYDSLGNRTMARSSMSSVGQLGGDGYVYTPRTNHLYNWIGNPDPLYYSYDPAGRVTAIVPQNPSPSGPTQARYLEYNSRGLLRRLRTADDRVTDYGYDDLGRRVYKRYDDPSSDCVWEFFYVYGGGDFLGQRLLFETFKGSPRRTDGVMASPFEAQREYVWAGNELLALSEHVDIHEPPESVGCRAGIAVSQVSGGTVFNYAGYDYQYKSSPIPFDTVSSLPRAYQIYNLVLQRQQAGTGCEDYEVIVTPSGLDDFCKSSKRTILYGAVVFDLETTEYSLYPSSPVPVPRVSELLHVHNDIRLVPVALSDSQGSLVWKRSVDEFGLATDFRVPIVLYGHYADFESGYYYNVIRYYDPQRGRYLQPDPLRSMNPYVYANNNPIRYADPTGAFAIELKVSGSLDACWMRTYCPAPGRPGVDHPSCWPQEFCGTYSNVWFESPAVHESITTEVYNGLNITRFPLGRENQPLLKAVNPTVEIGPASTSLALRVEGPVEQADTLINGVVGADVYHGLPSIVAKVWGGVGYDETYHFDNSKFQAAYARTGETPGLGARPYDVCKGQFDSTCPGCLCPIVQKTEERETTTNTAAREEVSYACLKPELRDTSVGGGVTSRILRYNPALCAKEVLRNLRSQKAVSRTIWACPVECWGHVPCKETRYYGCTFKPYSAGLILHAIQDFWAHTNAAETVLGTQPRKAEFGDPAVPGQFFSGSFDGESPCKALLADHRYCDDVNIGPVNVCRLPRNPFAHCELNKDTPFKGYYRASSIDYATLHSHAKRKAFEDATRALKGWCERGQLSNMCY